MLKVPDFFNQEMAKTCIVLYKRTKITGIAAVIHVSIKTSQKLTYCIHSKNQNSSSAPAHSHLNAAFETSHHKGTYNMQILNGKTGRGCRSNLSV